MKLKARPLARILVAAAVAFSPGILALTQAAPAAAKPAKHHKLSAGYNGPFRYVGIATAPGQAGYWRATTRGNVLASDGAPFYGSPVSQHQHLDHPVVAIASSPFVNGYLEVTSVGRVLAYGKAHNYGSVRQKLTSPVVSIAFTNHGRGYLIVTANGTVYRFGAAHKYGTLAASQRLSPVVAIVVTSDSRGYDLVTANGGVFHYGDARYYGSLTGRNVSSRVVSAALYATGGGYYLVTANGGVYNFGRAAFKGSAKSSRPASPVTSIATSRSGSGYLLLRANGKVLAYGAAHKVVTPPSTDPLKSGTYGYDVSWPECNSPRPDASDAFVIVGVNDGHAFSTNPCVGLEWRWALSSPHHWVYLNTDNPGYNGAAAYSFGEQAAQQSLNTTARLGINSTIYWLDVETTNVWAGSHSGNTEVILGFIHQLKAAKRVVGIYSTGYQWGQITGGYRITTKTPQWVPGAPSNDMPSYCSTVKRFASGKIWMTQSSPGNLDYDYGC